MNQIMKKSFLHIANFFFDWQCLSYNPLSGGTVISHDCTIKTMALQAACRSPMPVPPHRQTDRHLKASIWPLLLPAILSDSPVIESWQPCCSTSSNLATWKAGCWLHLLVFRAKFSSWEAAELRTSDMELGLSTVVKVEARVTDKQQEITSWRHKLH